MSTPAPGDSSQRVLRSTSARKVTERKLRERELRRISAELTAANLLLTDAVSAAKANEARYRALVDHLPDTVAYVWDRAHRVTVATGAGFAIRGLDATRLVGRSADEVMTPADAALVHGYLDEAFCGRTVSVEGRFETTGIENQIDVVPLQRGAGIAAPEDGGSRGPDEVLLVARDIGRIKDRERAMVSADQRWRTAFDGAPVGMAETDLDGRILRSNAALATILGRSTEQLQDVVLFDCFHPDEWDDARARTSAFAAGSPASRVTERRLPSASGEQRWVSNHTIRLSQTGDAPDRLLVHMVDITERRRQQALLEAAYARFSALVEHSSDAIAVIDKTGAVSYASPAYGTLTGTTAVLGSPHNFFAHIHPTDSPGVERNVGALVEGSSSSFECRLRQGAAAWRHVEGTASNRLAEPAIAGIVVNLRDITERVEVAARLAHQAMHDTLTNLPNRALLLDRLNQTLARAARSAQPCAVLFLDLDRFKEVNDSLGHAAGDRVLTAVAERLLRVVRPGDSVARLGGDEFVILAENIGVPANAQEIARRIHAAMASPVVLTDKAVTIGCSIGIAVSANHTPDSLLQEADTALYEAKKAGRNRSELYDQVMRTHAQHRLDTEQLVRTAATGERLVVHYQPIISLQSGRVVGTEALARIRHPDGRLIPPGEFIPVAEDTGLIVALGEAVLQRACLQQACWQAEGTGIGHVAVNVSARQVTCSGFADYVVATLASTGLPANMLCLELTESALIDAGQDALREVLTLQGLGVTFALDDFGTGWSSLSYLRRFPFDVVKIDRSFVAGLGTNNDDTEVVKAVIGLGRALRLETVAEGVETADQARILGQLGCDFVQGYFFGRPAPAEDLSSAERSGHRLASPASIA